MDTYLFVTKSEFDPQRVEEGESMWWSCSKSTKVGDRLNVYVTEIGIEYEWRATSEAEPNVEWDYTCGVEHVRTFDPPITLDDIRETFSRDEWAPPHLNFRGYRSIRIPDEVAQKLDALWPSH